MPFEKGQSGNPNGRPKGSKNKMTKSSLHVKYKDLYNRIIGTFQSGKYYVYYHIDSRTNEVIYIGKGCGDRAWSKDRNKDWIGYAKENDYTVQIICSFLSEQEAFAVEKALISTVNPKFNIDYN